MDQPFRSVPGFSLSVKMKYRLIKFNSGQSGKLNKVKTTVYKIFSCDASGFWNPDEELCSCRPVRVAKLPISPTNAQ